MEAVRGWFGPVPDNEAPASVLAEWQKYEVEQAGPSSSDKVLTRMEEGSSSVGGFLSGHITRATTGAKGLHTQVTTHVETYRMPSTQQFAYFFAFIGAGLVFMILAFSVFLPVIALAPSKFALSFTIGSLLVMAGFAALRGLKQQASHMLSASRLPFTAGYLTTMFGTLYAALVMHSYVMSLVCCSLQLVALIYYVASYFPGGTQGVKFVMMMATSAVKQCMYGVRQAVVGK